MRLADPTAFYHLNENHRGIGLMPTVDVDLQGLLRGHNLPAEPIPFRPNVGSVPADVIMGGAVQIYLISARFREVLEAGGFTGWTTYAVAAIGRRGVALPGYSGLSFTGRAGLPHWEFGESFTKRYVEHGPDVAMIRGLYFDADTWDGSDLFLLGDTAFRIVTARVADAVRAAKLRNIRLTRLRDFEIAEDTAYWRRRYE